MRLKLQASHSYHHWLNDLRTAPQHFPRIRKVYTEPQFLGVIGTKVFLAIHSHPYSLILLPRWAKMDWNWFVMWTLNTETSCLRTIMIHDYVQKPQRNCTSWIRLQYSKRNRPLGVKYVMHSLLRCKIILWGFHCQTWSYVLIKSTVSRWKFGIFVNMSEKFRYSASIDGCKTITSKSV